MTSMKVLLTGHQGFIGKNLMLRLHELPEMEVVTFGRSNQVSELPELLKDADVIVHLAGENRPKSDNDFNRINVGLTLDLCNAIRASRRKVRIIFASSTQASGNNPYGLSKLKAEKQFCELVDSSPNSVAIYRLPNIFGKWCKPNYNSVVATFCNNISQNLPIQVNDPNTELTLSYIDDVIDDFMAVMGKEFEGVIYPQVDPQYQISLAALVKQLEAFRSSRESLITEQVGSGLTRALYATYISYLRAEQFSYELCSHDDDRGAFVEVLKTRDSGQFSFFTAKPGTTRGGHYHHSKTEKFLVISGQAKFGFRHMLTHEKHELVVSGEKPQIVETIPGWAHDIKNIGDSELVVMLWANEKFDKAAPDTIASTVI